MLADQVKDQLLTRILGGVLVPGERVVETRVARELGISQGPVREALRDLATLGLVELHPYRGARVRRPATAEFREAMRVRAELEVMAAVEACPRVTAGDLATLQAQVELMLREVAGGDLKAYVRGNTEFHRTVMRLSGNRTLQRLWELLEPFARTYITATAAPIDPKWVRRSHMRIVRALASGDPEAAAAAAREHARDNQSRVGRRDAAQAVAVFRAGSGERIASSRTAGRTR
jgi:DNA-binding GntR family transcriptional regulator